MNNPICNTVFDSRDLIEYRDYLIDIICRNWEGFCVGKDISVDGEYRDNEQFCDEFYQEIEELDAIVDFCDELDYGDFEYGCAIIHENYIEEYFEEFCNDIGHINKDAHYVVVDWGATADNLLVDYAEFEYKGETYYVRG